MRIREGGGGRELSSHWAVISEVGGGRGGGLRAPLGLRTGSVCGPGIAASRWATGGCHGAPGERRGRPWVARARRRHNAGAGGTGRGREGGACSSSAPDWAASGALSYRAGAGEGVGGV